MQDQSAASLPALLDWLVMFGAIESSGITKALLSAAEIDDNY